MPRYLSDVASGRRSIDQPNTAAIAVMPVFIVLPAALVANDLIAIAKLAPGVKLVDFDIFAPQLDSNGAPALAHSIGAENAGATDLGVVYEAGLTFGRTANGSVSRASTAVQALADSSVERMISLKTTTAAATAALAGKTILVNLHLQG